MRKSVVAVLVVLTVLFTTNVVFAYNNKYTSFYFYYSGQQQNSMEVTEKSNDGDPLCYCTTLAANPYSGQPSTVFTHGGTVYSRIRNVSRSDCRSCLFTYITNEWKSNPYADGNVYYLEEYYLRAEMECDYTSSTLYQSFKWCP